VEEDEDALILFPPIHEFDRVSATVIWAPKLAFNGGCQCGHKITIDCVFIVCHLPLKLLLDHLINFAKEQLRPEFLLTDQSVQCVLLDPEAYGTPAHDGHVDDPVVVPWEVAKDKVVLVTVTKPLVGHILKSPPLIRPANSKQERKVLV
jgi:hypothetical protein